MMCNPEEIEKVDDDDDDVGRSNVDAFERKSPSPERIGNVTASNYL